MTPLGGARLGRSVRGAHPPGNGRIRNGGFGAENRGKLPFPDIVPADLFRHLRRVELSRPVP